MSRYIADPRHLRLVMKALADPSQAIAFEAFHVFKIFAANPNKTKEVEDILLRNRVRCSPPFPVAELFASIVGCAQDKLLGFLPTFQDAKAEEDPQFQMERQKVVDDIAALAPEPAAGGGQ